MATKKGSLHIYVLRSINNIVSVWSCWYLYRYSRKIDVIRSIFVWYWNWIYFVLAQFLFDFSGGPYAGFAGRDASRGLATFSVDAITDEYDDLSDLKASELEQVITGN